MQLTHYTDYSLRVLLYLSLQDEERVTISDIAERFQIPRNHLVKVVHHLGKLNYIHTTRGKKGGLKLAMPADEISIGTIVREMETRLDIMDCNAPSTCPILPLCRLKHVLHEACDAFLQVLDGYTVADLQQAPEDLKNLLCWRHHSKHSSTVSPLNRYPG
jgi:Rrf2 family nitric oxide-sensitive transcriptional repressor